MTDQPSESTTGQDRSATPNMRRLIVIVILFVTPVTAVLVAVRERNRQLSVELVCGSYLKGIGTSLKIYANDFPNEASPTIEDLIDEGQLSRKQTICPATDLSVSNYVVVLPLTSIGLDNRSVVLYEPKSNHGVGGNVVFADGHAKFVKGDEYDRLTAEASTRIQQPSSSAPKNP